MSFDSVAHTNQFVSMRQKPFDVRTKASDVRQKTSDIRQKASDEEVTLPAVVDYPRIVSDILLSCHYASYNTIKNGCRLK